jgi:flagellar M-ring protein FliF
MAVALEDQEDGARRFPVSAGRAIALLILILMLVTALYWFVLRTVYVPVFEGLSPTDAAAVVAELDERKIAHRLAGGGSTILVAEAEADQARLSIAASELPFRGQTGFELFNESDMGLTEFAQKINYQRALQGELSRTIMLLDGIENARVHLALPDRAIFRSERVPPTAAVTLILKPGHMITSARIQGIRRLIAGSVPGLGVDAVTIVDDSGQLVSPAPAPASTANVGSEVEAAQLYYRTRVANIIASVAPDLRPRVDITVRPRADRALGGDPGRSSLPSESSIGEAREPELAATDTDGLAVGDNGERDYALLVTITTSDEISPAVRDQISTAVIAAAGLSEDRQDRLAFAVGPAALDDAARGRPQADLTVVSRQDDAPPTPQASQPSWLTIGTLAIFGVLAIIMFSVFLMRRRSAAATGDPVDSFAEQLKARLAMQEVTGA